MTHKLYDKLILPKGHKIGMGKLKSDTEVTVLRIEKREDGSEFYCVQLEDGRYTFTD